MNQPVNPHELLSLLFADSKARDDFYAHDNQIDALEAQFNAVKKMLDGQKLDEVREAFNTLAAMLYNGEVLENPDEYKREALEPAADIYASGDDDEHPEQEEAQAYTMDELTEEQIEHLQKVERAMFAWREQEGIEPEVYSDFYDWLKAEGLNYDTNDFCNGVYVLLRLKELGYSRPSDEMLSKALDTMPLPEKPSYATPEALQDAMDAGQEPRAYVFDEERTNVDSTLADSARRAAGIQLAQIATCALLDRDEYDIFYDQLLPVEDEPEQGEVPSLEELLLEVGEKFYFIKDVSEVEEKDDMLNRRMVHWLLTAVRVSGENSPMTYGAVESDILLLDLRKVAADAREEVAGLKQENTALKDENATLRAELEALRAEREQQNSDVKQNGWANSHHVQPKQISAGNGRAGGK
jgi:cell division protein FtsB